MNEMSEVQTSTYYLYKKIILKIHSLFNEKRQSYKVIILIGND